LQSCHLDEPGDETIPRKTSASTRSGSLYRPHRVVTSRDNEGSFPCLPACLITRGSFAARTVDPLSRITRRLAADGAAVPNPSIQKLAALDAELNLVSDNQSLHDNCSFQENSPREPDIEVAKRRALGRAPTFRTPAAGKSCFAFTTMRLSLSFFLPSSLVRLLTPFDSNAPNSMAFRRMPRVTVPGVIPGVTSRGTLPAGVISLALPPIASKRPNGVRRSPLGAAL